MGKKTISNQFLIIVIIISCFLCLKCSQDYYQDITDLKVLPMLKNLPSEYDRGNITPRDGRLLYDLVLQNGYKNGLEIGTSNGYSALWQGLAFRQNKGRLLTLEIDSIVGKEAQGNFIKSGLQEFIDLKIDDAKNVLSGNSERFDFVFVDTGNSGLDFFKLTLPFVKNGGTIVIHNVKKNDSRLNTITNNSELSTRFKSHLFYNILICTKK